MELWQYTDIFMLLKYEYIYTRYKNKSFLSVISYKMIHKLKITLSWDICVFSLNFGSIEIAFVHTHLRFSSTNFNEKPVSLKFALNS